MSNSDTPGGNRLRILREAAGKTQLEVELDANLGTGYLQRVESGKVQHPERDTLERILAALEARYTERRDILERFGYLVDAPLPTEQEINWAVNLCQAELESAIFPAYLLDCGHRLLVWNAMFPRLFHIEGVTHHPRPGLRVSMLSILFDDRLGMAQKITNPDIFFPASIRALRSEMQLFHSEVWYNALIAEQQSASLNFEKYWMQADSKPKVHFAARPLTPLEITLPECGVLQFRLMAEAFIQDRRFRVIYLLPADPLTMQQCATWSQS